MPPSALISAASSLANVLERASRATGYCLANILETAAPVPAPRLISDRYNYSLARILTDSCDSCKWLLTHPLAIYCRVNLEYTIVEGYLFYTLHYRGTESDHLRPIAWNVAWAEVSGDVRVGNVDSGSLGANIVGYIKKESISHPFFYQVTWLG